MIQFNACYHLQSAEGINYICSATSFTVMSEAPLPTLKKQNHPPTKKPIAGKEEEGLICLNDRDDTRWPGIKRGKQGFRNSRIMPVIWWQTPYALRRK